VGGKETDRQQTLHLRVFSGLEVTLQDRVTIEEITGPLQTDDIVEMQRNVS
jgi:hypothetical protein